MVAPDDPLTVDNRSREAVDVSVDGLVAGELGAGESLSTRFLRHAGALAQEPGSSFYKRLRDKFGKLAA